MFNPTPLLHNRIPWNYHAQHKPQWRPRAPFPSPRPSVLYHQAANDTFWCETCDRGFPTEIILNKHKQQHQKCNIDGCQFIAHPKVITKHIQMQHSTGLYKKISNINNPEDIKKWREERKKRYPTKSNIEKRAALLKEKIDRGEKMGLNCNKNRFNNDKNQSIKRKYSMHNENNHRSKFKRHDNVNLLKNPKPRKNNPKSLPPVEEQRKLKPFAGILNLQMHDEKDIEESSDLNNLIEDDKTEEAITKEAVNTSELRVCGALSNLMCDYGSSDEEDDKEFRSGVLASVKIDKVVVQRHFEGTIKSGSKIETPECDKINGKKFDLDSSIRKQYNVVTDSNLSQSIIDNDGNESGPEEEKVIKTEDSSMQTVESDAKLPSDIIRKKKYLENKKIFQRPKPRVPSTLLHKLLFKEMQQERNIVLQCIRYIRKNDYFDKT